MSATGGDDKFEPLQPSSGFGADPLLEAWRHRLKALPSTKFAIRDATATAQDARRVWDLQVECSPIIPKPLRENVSMIVEKRVLLAFVDDVHVGFSVSFAGPRTIDPLFVQVVAVVLEARRRGVGIALLGVAAAGYPRRDIALATQLDNVAARTMNDRFAESIGASIRRVPLDNFANRDLGIRRGLGYRAWFIQHPPSQPPAPLPSQ
jgi:hypothetical protein